MWNKIRSICLSRTNIIAVSISTYAFLKDVQEFITGFASHLKFVLIAFIVLIVLMMINLILTSRTNQTPIERSKDDSLAENTSIDKFKNQSSLVFTKILFSICLFISIMTVGSLLYVKNMDVYYVVLKNNLSENQAKKISMKTNKIKSLREIKLLTRPIEYRQDKWEVILFNGYISRERAIKDSQILENLNLNMKFYIAKSPAKFTRKISYLQKQLFN